MVLKICMVLALIFAGNTLVCDVRHHEDFHSPTPSLNLKRQPYIDKKIGELVSRALVPARSESRLVTKPPSCRVRKSCYYSYNPRAFATTSQEKKAHPEIVCRQ